MTIYWHFEKSSPQTVTTGESDQSAGSHMRDEIHPRNSIPLPSGSIASPVPALKSLNIAQALLDGLVVVSGLIALVAAFGSLPLAVGLMIFGVF